MRRCLTVLFLFLGCASTQTDAPTILAGLDTGPQRVGFHSQLLASPALQVSFWYPAAGSGSPLTWRDLYLLTLMEKSASEPSVADRETRIQSYKSVIVEDGAPPAAVDQLLALRFLAQRDARAQRIRRPLVLIAQGNFQSVVNEAVLGELLASHGFVVATVPSITRLNGPFDSDEQLGERVASESANLERAMREAAARPDVDASCVAVIGYSLGARSALFFAARHPVNALVSLDGGIGTATGDRGNSELPGALPPILHLYETNDTRITSDLTFLRSLKTDLRAEKFDSFMHPHFSSIGAAAAQIPALAASTHAGPNVAEEWRRMSDDVVNFIEENAQRSCHSTP